MVRIRTMDRPTHLLELARVRTRRALRQGNEFVFGGAVGTIVCVYEEGKAFEVEFADPSAVIAANRSDLKYA